MFNALKSYIEYRKKAELEAFQAKMAEIEKEEAYILAFCSRALNDETQSSAEVVETKVIETEIVETVEATIKTKKPKKAKSKKPKHDAPALELNPEPSALESISTPTPPLPSSPVVQKEPSEYKKFSSKASVLIKEALDSAKAPLGFYTKVSGYMYSTGLKDNLTVESVKEAIKYLNDHPEYVSKTKQKAQKE